MSCPVMHNLWNKIQYPLLDGWLKLTKLIAVSCLFVYLFSYWYARPTRSSRRTRCAGTTGPCRKMQSRRLLLPSFSKSVPKNWEMNTYFGYVLIPQLSFPHFFPHPPLTNSEISVLLVNFFLCIFYRSSQWNISSPD